MPRQRQSEMDPADYARAAAFVHEEARKVRPDLFYVPVPIFDEQFHSKLAHIRFLITCNQIGKTSSAACEVNRHALGENPLGADWPFWCPPPIRAWWVAPTFDHLQQGLYKVLREGIMPRDPKLSVLSENRHTWKWPSTGSVCILKAAEQDLITFEADTINIAVADEEIPEPYWNALFPRLGVRHGCIIVPATPIETARAGGISWLTRRYLSPWLAGKWSKCKPRERVIFVRAGRVHASEDKVLPGGRLFKAFWDAKSIQLERDNLTPEEAAVRLDGEITSLAGSLVWPAARVAALRQDPWPTPHLVGDVEFPSDPNADYQACVDAAKFVAPGNGLTVFKEPVPNHSYIIGGDFAEGVPTGDFTGMPVFDRDDGEVVAVWWGHCAPFHAARRMACLGAIYNEALLVPEENNKEGGAVVSELVRLGYPCIYWRHDESRPDHSDRKPGWLTTVGTRARCINAITKALPNADGTEKWITVNFEPLFHEMSIFSIIDGRPDHPDGEHDDLLMPFGMLLTVHMDPRYAMERRVSPVNDLYRRIQHLPVTHQMAHMMIHRQQEIQDGTRSEDGMYVKRGGGWMLDRGPDDGAGGW